MKRIGLAAVMALLAGWTASRAGDAPEAPWQWAELVCSGEPHARHEAGFVACGERLYLLGGRRVQPVDVLDPATRSWRTAPAPPMEIHHFQAVVWAGRIYLPGAMTGPFPRERGLDHVPVFDPESETWSRGPEVPKDRRRGAAGAVVAGDDLYVIGGIVDGHRGGYVPWLDKVNLRTGEWTRLPDAPRARDHFQAALLDGIIYAAGGRTSSQATGQVFQLTVAPVDVWDLARGEWSTLAEVLPTPRAGNATVAAGGLILVIGGESGTRREAHDEVEAYDPARAEWRALPGLARGRHGTAVAVHEVRLYIASGSGHRGGGPELTSVEVARADAGGREK